MACHPLGHGVIVPQLSRLVCACTCVSRSDVRVLAAQMGLPALVVRREFNKAITMKFDSMRRRMRMSGSTSMSMSQSGRFGVDGSRDSFES